MCSFRRFICFLVAALSVDASHFLRVTDAVLRLDKANNLSPCLTIASAKAEQKEEEEKREEALHHSGLMASCKQTFRALA